MISLLRTLSNTNNSNRSSNEPSRPVEVPLRSPTGAPILPPLIGPGTGPIFPGFTLAAASSSSGSGSRHAAPIPIPGRRQSEPAVRSLTAAPTITTTPPPPDYAVSPRSQVSSVSRASAPIPTYEVALSQSPSVRDSPAGWDGERWVRDYFGSSPSQGALPPIEDVEVEMGEIEEEDDDDDPLLPRPHGPRHNLHLARRYTVGGVPTTNEDGEDSPPDSGGMSSSLNTRSYVTQMLPPTALPPAYSSDLAHDELRLISSVHLSSDHPASAFFNAITSPPPASDPLPGNAEPANLTTGKKKMKLTLTKGGERTNSNGTGPLFIRVGRAGLIEGTIEVGNVEHATELEVSILGMVHTSYYVRGQYTLLDTMPLTRLVKPLFPPGPDDPPLDPYSLRTKDGAPLIQPGQTFPFSLNMPTSHFRDEDIQLPPSCEVLQVAIQATVEYVLRVKMIRKGWRLNEIIGVPIIYEPRAYIPPRRLRALTSEDPLNPGWRTIRLNGGQATPKCSPAETGTAVEVSLLVPSPPILFIPHGSVPPPIPFHLHFTCPLSEPLSVFSNPKECTFRVRFNRVVTMKIGAAKELRRIELPCKVEVWQEGGEKIVLGEEVKPPAPRRNSTNSAAAASGSSGTAESSTAGGSQSGRRGSTTSNTGERKRSFSFAERRGSFMARRRSSAAAPVVTSTTAGIAAPNQQSLDRSSADSTRPTGISSSVESSSSATALELTQTDVHLLGSLQIKIPFMSSSNLHPGVLRGLMQSFNTPEIGVTYVLEVGIEPKKGSVKESYGHVWGGGIIEVVLGARG
ncbi:hypothetical protein CI109_100606 [Kwoniella shandongensis]|uniref:Uncharacterized protein n=1 Tax=Kwoniella shandongensis TaxID=1734106 RepID=A0A5M6BZL7_9TREE|nr:uncharacterized protein CI109_003472 [Kwoniella shandongensis]KAA5528183.1 hypothetical protein CI109_003472 [Kwoniella shandongensis]